MNDFLQSDVECAVFSFNAGLRGYPLRIVYQPDRKLPFTTDQSILAKHLRVYLKRIHAAEHGLHPSLCYNLHRHLIHATRITNRYLKTFAYLEWLRAQVIDS